MEKRGVIDEDNTPPETPTPKQGCCGGSCHENAAKLEDHPLTRVSNSVKAGIDKNGNPIGTSFIVTPKQ